MWEGDPPPIFVAVIYIPPDVAFRSDPQFINRLRSCGSEYSDKIIMGYWNIDMSNSRDPAYKSLQEFIDAESLQLIETGPTHHTKGRGTWYDLLLVDQSDVVLKSNRLPLPFRSRHDIVNP